MVTDLDFRVAEPIKRQFGSGNGETTTIRVWSPRDLVDAKQFVLDVTQPILELLEVYFQVPFPNPKIDLLFINPETANKDDTTRVEFLIAHDLVNQWVGNLVTMKWWNDQWLSEGFANYIQNIVLDYISPKYQSGIQYDLNLLNALAKDATESSHPVSVQVQDPRQMKKSLDDISYNKGI